MTTLRGTRPVEASDLVNHDVPHWVLNVWDREDDPAGPRFNLDGADAGHRLIADHRVASLVNAMLAAGCWSREPGGDWTPDDHTNITVGTRMITVIVSVPKRDTEGMSEDDFSVMRYGRLEQLNAHCRHIDQLVDRARAMLPLL